jgi:hypothetical protein
MDKINVYEYSGIVCPGIILIVGLAFLFPQYMQVLESLSIGAFGLILILAFCTGHILSAIGNIIEDLIYSPKRWTNYKLKNYKISGAMAYAKMQEKGKAAHLEIFSRLYGLTRGMFIAFACLGFIAIFIKSTVTEICILFGLSLLCLYRAFHFIRLYVKDMTINLQLLNKNTE